MLNLNPSDRGLDDDTKIGEYTWKEKKAEILPENFREFKSNRWYSKLSEDDKDLIDQLRTKQMNQQNMEPLEPKTLKIVDVTEDYVSSELP